MSGEPLASRGDVLAVDDTPENLTLLAAVLKGKGYGVRAVPSGALALSAAAAQTPDVVLLDVMMPGMDGYEVCRRLKEDDRLKHVPVIFLSALSETLDKVKAFSSGAVDYVTKPFQIEELEARVGTQVALRRTQAQLDLRNRELAERNARLQRMEDVRRRLTQMIVHDFKSPICAALSFATFIRDEAGLEGEFAEAVGDLAGTFGILDRMTHDLLDVAASDEGGLVPRLAPVALPELVDEILAEQRGGARLSKKTVTSEVARELGPVLADRDLLRRVVSNLIDNAFKYVRRGGQIVVDAAPEGASAYRIRVRDDGPGIPAELRERIFEPYARLERDLEVHARQSRGLGLAFCRLAVEAHGGRIWVEDNHPRGCAFVMELPRRPEGATAGGCRRSGRPCSRR